MPKKSKGLIQSYQIQDLAHKMLMRYGQEFEKEDRNVTKEDAITVANLTKAWETAQDRVRIHRGKPLPGSRKPQEPVPKNTTAEDAKPVD